MFHVDRCFPEGARERLAGDFGNVILREIRDLENCAETHFGWTTPRTPEDAALLIDACVTVRTGISIQYVYRGLYAAQLARCFASGVPKSNILVLDNDHLRRDPQSALDAIADHVGIQKFHYNPSDFHSDNLHDAIHQKYPTFEQNSGWRLQSDHSDVLLPDDVHRQVSSFFRPHNSLLFSMIGSQFNHWDNNLLRK